MTSPDDRPRPSVPADPGQPPTGGSARDGLAASDPAAVESATPDVAFAFGGEPDVGFTLSGAMASGPAPTRPGDAIPAAGPTEPAISEGEISEGETSPDPLTRARDLAHAIGWQLAEAGPEGWQQVTAVFTLTAVVGGGEVIYSDGGERTLQVDPPEAVLELAREHRDLSASFENGPWWRLLVQLDAAGQLEIDYDYGDEPFPDNQLLPPDAYLADLEVYPRDRLPVWLAAYIGHGDRQSRPPTLAAQQARADRGDGVVPVVSEDDFPPLSTMWGRWAVMAAAFVAAGSDWGPRVLPSLGWFEGIRRGGSTLYLLPGGRAVLSGGVWNAPALDAAYNGRGLLPQLYAGAPEWVANPVLNPRAGGGLLSFCYWWEGDRWYRAQSPGADQLSDALPGVWTTDTVAQVIAGLVDTDPGDELRSAVSTLVAAAEVGVVTRDTLVSVFGDDGEFDVDAGLYQLTLAGATTTGPTPMPEAEAIERVYAHLGERGTDSDGYPADELRADRISVGWIVYVPTEPGEIAIGRAVFYVADDGVLEQSSSSVAPSLYIGEFEQRFRERHGALRTF